MDPRSSLAAVVVTTLCVLVVCVRVAIAPSPPAKARATEADRAEMAQAVLQQERGWLRETAQNFPSDHWSQRDDFHGREYRKVEELAHERGVRVEDVLRAIDEDLHRRKANGPESPDDRSARAVPCKPRPFYD